MKHAFQRAGTPAILTRWLIGCLVGATCLVATPSGGFAQSTGEHSPLPSTSVPADNLDRQWRVWRRQLRHDTPTVGPIQAMTADAISLGIPNPRSHVLASIHELSPGGGDGIESNARRNETYRSLARLAPELPYAPLAHARATVMQSPVDVGGWLSAYFEGVRRSAAWLETAVGWGGQLGTGLLLALLSIVVVGLGMSVLRHIAIVGYDVARVLPDGITRTQVVTAIILGTAAVWWMWGSLVGAACVLFGILSWAQRPIERLPACLFASLLIAAPWLGPMASKAVTYPGSLAQQTHLAAETGCDADCRDRLTEAEADGPVIDAVRDYTLAVATARTTEPADLRRAVEKLSDRDRWPDDIAPWVKHLQGAIHAARGRLEPAIEQFEAIRGDLPGSFALAYNTMTTRRRLGDDSGAAEAHNRAASLNATRLDRREALAASDVNSTVILPGLPDRVIWRAHGGRTASRLWSSLKAAVHGSSVPGTMRWWGIGLLAIVILTWAGAPMGAASRPCPRCGGPREPEDKQRTGGHAYCHPCYRAFVSSGSLHHRRRIRVEHTLRRRAQRRARMHRVLSAICPGSGHLLAGYPIRGALLTGMFAAALTLLFDWSLVGPPPGAMFGIDWVGWTPLAILLGAPAILVGLWRASRGLEPYDMRP